MSFNLEELECHFKWNPVDIHETINLDQLIQQQTLVSDIFDDFILFKLNLIGYLYTRVTPPDYTNALKYFDKVLTKDNETEAYKGHNYITTANKIHTLNCLGDRQDKISSLLDSLEEVETLPPKARAVVHGHHGFLLRQFGKSNYLPSTEAYMASMKLDPQNYLWPLGFAWAAGKFRRIEEGVRTLANQSEERNLRKSIVLSCEKKALPIVSLAELLFCNARDFCQNSPSGCNDVKLMEEAGWWFDKAYQINPHSVDVLMRYGKFFSINGEYGKGTAMMKKACELNPYNSQAWFRLGQAYRFSNIPDLDKAEEYHLKAVTIGYRRYFFAELDLGWIRFKKDNNYNIIQHFEEMRTYYANDENRQKMLDNQIQNVNDMLSRRQEQLEEQTKYRNYRKTEHRHFRGMRRTNNNFMNVNDKKHINRTNVRYHLNK